MYHGGLGLLHLTLSPWYHSPRTSCLVSSCPPLLCLVWMFVLFLGSSSIWMVWIPCHVCHFILEQLPSIHTALLAAIAAVAEVTLSLLLGPVAVARVAPHPAPFAYCWLRPGFDLDVYAESTCWCVGVRVVSGYALFGGELTTDNCTAPNSHTQKQKNNKQAFWALYAPTRDIMNGRGRGHLLLL